MTDATPNQADSGVLDLRRSRRNAVRTEEPRDRGTTLTRESQPAARPHGTSPDEHNRSGGPSNRDESTVGDRSAGSSPGTTRSRGNDNGDTATAVGRTTRAGVQYHSDDPIEVLYKGVRCASEAAAVRRGARPMRGRRPSDPAAASRTGRDGNQRHRQAPRSNGAPHRRVMRHRPAHAEHAGARSEAAAGRSRARRIAAAGHTDRTPTAMNWTRPPERWRRRADGCTSTASNSTS